ncbi:flagellar assembly protein FliH [Veronia nyctiphanis]|uniref:Flagellar assembly protein FliH n=2 Tax=Veronia nyctiphanis TaxID=1278244 RepID=A0A4Q0YPF9_9GAMM|nr:flagellar assembly protein FliH [Veronia nyctiphanis]
MTDDRRRGFIRSNELPSDTFSRWSLPDHHDKKPPPRETALNFDPGWAPEIEEEDLQHNEPHVAVKPLTADDLEEIHSSAVEEGREEGRQAGFDEGREAGFAEGREAGFEEGREAGYQEGLTNGQQTIDEKCQQLGEMIEKLAHPLQQVDQSIHQQMMDVVLMLTRSLIDVEVQTNPQVILSTLREAVQSLPVSGRKVSVYLHPEDRERVEDAHGEQGIAERNWKLVSEPSLNVGDIQLHCEDSSVDYRMEDRVRHLLEQFSGQNPVPDVPAPPGNHQNVLLDEPKEPVGEPPVVESEIHTETSEVMDASAEQVEEHTEPSAPETTPENNNAEPV